MLGGLSFWVTGFPPAHTSAAGGRQCDRICPDGYLWPDCSCRPYPPGTTPTPTPTPFLYGPKGIGDAWQNWQTPNPGTNLDALDFDWYYDWTWSYVPITDRVDTRYVMMVWCNAMVQTDRNGVSHTITETAQADLNANRRGRVWLVYNEPDVPGQCGAHPESDAVYAAHHYSTVYDVIKGADPHARVFAGGLVHLSSPQVRSWWQTFVNTLQAEGKLYKLQGVHVHLYPSTSTSASLTLTPCPGYCVPELTAAADDWYNQMHVGLGLGDRPIWISETGWLNCPTDQTSIRDNYMQPLSQWFANDPAWASRYPDVPANPGYDAIAWYVTHDSEANNTCTYLLNRLGSGGSATTLGVFWNSYRP
jgi:hypothetical protein